ncbi:hypothetical protein [Roseateles puraquae]|jgi:hypothetical protein|uniref:Uncharacterized protein n=1 Tax=Roseateles puraquae TaxID=431059 RepID=A0A254N7A7_9BURK|nr:hypothetical protein [Roseateles puraquae]MDG0856478.1 hypothetical protein [Roseateles puraquae]OWR02692.1 hypothetical protein CDO81_17840 [Roseateles puraquae]
MGSAVSSVFGGGGSGGILGAVGGIVGGIFGGPIGAMIGQAIGGMLQQAVGDATKQAVDTLQQEHGMPKFLADEVKSKIDSAVQSLLAQSQHGVTQEAAGQAQQVAGDWMQSFIQDAAKQIVDEATKQLKGDGSSGGKASAESWLVAIAKAMGKTMGDRAAKLVDLSQRIANTQTGGSNNAQQAAAKQMQQLNAEFQATSQEFSLLQNTFSTAIKAIGEAMSSVARKQ